jgi:hypothetical protein
LAVVTSATGFDACSGKNVLTIASGYGGTTDPSPGFYYHDPGSVVSVRAIPNSSYQFSSWTGDASGNANPIDITMNSSKSITANFYSTGGNGGGGDTGTTDWGDSGGGGGRSGCFVATAAYGSGLHPAVRMLREFRDRRLLTNAPGRALVKLYYRWSPPLARSISRNGFGRSAARLGLAPFIALAFAILHLGYAWTAAALGLFGLPAGLRAMRRRRGSGRDRR